MSKLPNVAEASERIKQAYASSVLQVLAARGYAAHNMKQANDLLSLTERGRSMAPAQPTPDTIYAEANYALDKMASVNPVQQAAVKDAALYEYCASLAQSPEIYNSVLSLRANQADTAAR